MTAFSNGTVAPAKLAHRPPAALLLALDAPDGHDRALQPIGGHTLIEEHVRALRLAGVKNIAVVRRAGARDLPHRVGDVSVVLQPFVDATELDSIVLGLFALGDAPVVVMPVELDLVGDDTLELVVAQAAREAATHAFAPSYAGRQGFPVLLYRTAIGAVIRDANDPDGVHDLRHLLERWTGGVALVDVTDDAVVREFNAPGFVFGEA